MSPKRKVTVKQIQAADATILKIVKRLVRAQHSERSAWGENTECKWLLEDVLNLFIRSVTCAVPYTALQSEASYCDCGSHDVYGNSTVELFSKETFSGLMQDDCAGKFLCDLYISIDGNWGGQVNITAQVSKGGGKSKHKTFSFDGTRIGPGMLIKALDWMNANWPATTIPA